MGGTVGTLSAVQQQLWSAVVETRHLLVAALDRELRDRHGVSLDDYDLLRHLDGAPGRSLRMNELAELTLMPKSRLTYRVDRLEAKGYLVRRSDLDDGRGIRAEITRSGRSMVARMSPTYTAALHRHVFSHLSSDEVATVGVALSRVLDRIRPLVSA
jgi:DNA-binding MarR family transcriptional regulator